MEGGPHNFHDLSVEAVDRCRVFDFSSPELLQVQLFGLGERIEYRHGDIRIVFKYIIAHDYQVVDGIVPGCAQGFQSDTGGIGDQRCDVWVIRIHPDCGRYFAAGEHVFHFSARFQGHYIVRCLPVLHVFVTGKHPGNFFQIHTVLLLQNGTRQTPVVTV